MQEIIENILKSGEWVAIVLSLDLFSSIKNILKNYALDKTNREEFILDDDSVSFIRININRDKLSVCIKPKVIRKFLDVIGKNVSKEDFDNISRNLAVVKINSFFNDSVPLSAKFSNFYRNPDHSIYYSFSYALSHELLHAASSLPYVDGYSLVGFDHCMFVNNSWNEIGRGINEGYTELLASRYFNHNLVCGYYELVKIVKLLECFFEDPKDMQHLYFNANLLGVIKQLEKYATHEEALQIITETDKLCNYNNNLTLGLILSTKLQVELYQIFSRCDDREKVEEFRKKVCSNLIVSAILNGKKFKLERDNPYNSTFDKKK